MQEGKGKDKENRHGVKDCEKIGNDYFEGLVVKMIEDKTMNILTRIEMVVSLKELEQILLNKR